MPFTIADLLSASSSPFSVFLFILRNGGLVVFFPVFVWMCWQLWKYWIQNLYSAKKKYVLLAIDVPRDNEQSMRAIEHIMTALHGVHFNPNLKEKYWIGVLQDKFSLEIVSIEGYIQYFVYCDNYNADLVKAAVYAQYPDAEIVEVEDYVPNVPYKYPDETYTMWGTEFVLAKNDVYPLRTYEQFEHSLTGVFADPMAAILEVMSRLRPGEQVWLQIVITPEGITWREKGIKEVYKLIEKKVKVPRNLLDVALDTPVQGLGIVHDALFGPFEKNDKDDRASSGNFLNLTTGEKFIVEEIQKKIARIVWKTKFRFVYVGPQDIFDTYRVVGSIYGAVKQFNTLDLNAFKAGSKTIVSRPTYFFVQRRRRHRRNKMMMAYKVRSNWAGEAASVLSDVEVATIFHFPSIIVRAPLVSRTETKKAEPPSRLPFEAVSPFSELRSPRVVAPEPPAPTPAAPAAASTAPVAAQEEPAAGPPLHSMPGLPPGVRKAYRPFHRAPSPHARSPFPVPYRSRPQGAAEQSFSVLPEPAKTPGPSAPSSQPPSSPRPSGRTSTNPDERKSSPPADLPFA